VSNERLKRAAYFAYQHLTTGTYNLKVATAIASDAASETVQRLLDESKLK